MSPNLDTVKASILAQYPKWKCVSKDESWVMRLLGRVAGHMFMMVYATTIGYTTYLPTAFDSFPVESQCSLLRHESIHLGQWRSWWIIYPLSYLLFPLPLFLAYFRARWEFAAYVESMKADAEYYGLAYIQTSTYRDWLLSQFTSSAYGWMFPLTGIVGGWIDKVVKGMAE